MSKKSSDVKKVEESFYPVFTRAGVHPLDLELNDIFGNESFNSVRLFNLLHKLGRFNTLKDLCACSKEEMLAIRNVSQKSVDYLDKKLKSVGLGFRPSQISPKEWIKKLKDEVKATEAQEEDSLGLQGLL